MKEKIRNTIQNLSLTATERIIANYVLDNLDLIGLQTSTTLAQNIGVSDATVVRFIKKIGFSGYLEFRKKMAEELIISNEQQNRELILPSHKFNINKNTNEGTNILQKIENLTLENIRKTFSKLNEDTINKISDIICSSKNRYIAAFRGTSCCAYYLANKLSFFLDNVNLLVHADSSVVEKLMSITTDDCLILFTFPQYSKINTTIMDMAAEKKAKIVLITDSLACPLAQKATIVIPANVDISGFSNSYVAPMFLIDLILQVTVSKETNSEYRMNLLETILMKSKMY